MHQCALQKAINLFGSQAALAEAIGVAKQTIGKYLNGIRNISPHNAILIANACKKRDPNTTITVAQLQPELSKLFNLEEKQSFEKAYIYRAEKPIKQIKGWDVIDTEPLEKLIADIRVHGLQRPVITTADLELIDGAKRVCACKQLGCKRVPVASIALNEILTGECDPFALKKEFLASERVRIGETLRKLIGVRQGARTDLQLHQDPDEVKSRKQTSDRIAPLLGFGDRTSYSEACRITWSSCDF